jgi:hypothetical protein
MVKDLGPTIMIGFLFAPSVADLDPGMMVGASFAATGDGCFISAASGLVSRKPSKAPAR